MKKLIIYIVAIVALTGAGACKKILQKVDFGGVPEQQVFNDPNVTNLYLDNLYSIAMPVWWTAAGAGSIPTGFHLIADENNGGNTAVLFTSASNSAYPFLRKINILLQNIDKDGMPSSQAEPIKAQAYFLRAWIYFQLWKVYGGIPYLTQVLNYQADSLNLPRNSSSQCVDSMLADLKHCSILPAAWSGVDQGRITSVAALALKGRILLYWASPQFNPGNDASRWQTAYDANRAAYDSLTNAGYALYSNYSRIFLDAANAADKEPILYRSYNANLTVNGLNNNWENGVRPFSQSAGSGGKSYNPTWEMVQAYPMADGKAITDATSSTPYDPVYYWKNRDPRFYASIVYNGAVYGTGSQSGRKQWSYTGVPEEGNNLTTTGFYLRRNIDTTVTAVNTISGKTWWVEMRLGEVMLNLAECANATGRQAEAYTMLTAIRKRAGIKAGSDNLYGLAAGMTGTDLQNAIMQERRIELAFEDKRYDDLRRTRTFDQLNGNTRSALVVTVKSPWITSTKPADANNPNNIERSIGGGVKVRDTINVDGPSYTKFFSTAVKPITGESKINFLPLYYFYAIPSSNISKQPAMQQNIGWLFAGAAGTFDPTK
jgi:hypothetical protein